MSNQEPTEQSPPPRDLEQARQIVRDHYPQRAEHEYFLVSDGSGHSDGFAGAACIMFSPQRVFCDIRCGSWSGSNTERAEFEALLMGLQAILDQMQVGQKEIEYLKKSRPLVHWTTDRAQLVGSIVIDPDTQKPFWRRSTMPDLWARFDFYHEIFRITPFYLSRNSEAWHRVVDEVSSDMRILMKEYGAAWPSSLAWMTGWELAWKEPAQFDTLVAETVQKLQESASTPEVWREFNSKMQIQHGSDLWGAVVSAAVSSATGGVTHKNLKGQTLPFN